MNLCPELLKVGTRAVPGATKLNTLFNKG